MNIDDAVLQRVRHSDPINPDDLLGWAHSDNGRRVFEAVIDAPVADESTPAGHRGRRLALTALAATVAMTAAAAASGVLGSSAPSRVREHLGSLDRGLPEDLRTNLDVNDARAVASTETGRLFAADLKAGGFCFEVASIPDRPRGAVCVTADHAHDRPVEVTAPIPLTPAGPLLVGGRVNDDRIAQIVTIAAGHAPVPVPFGLDRYWLAEVPDSERDEALNHGLIVAGLDADGHEVSRVSVPPLRDADPDGTAFDGMQPIFVSTISTGDDLTKVLAIQGTVNVAEAQTLSLVYPDGTTQTIDLGSNRNYHVTLPADRQDDFAASTGHLVARNASGDIVATAPVSSVANQHRKS